MSILKKKKNAATGKRQRYTLMNKLPFPVQEAIKDLRTNVIFSLPGDGCKCIGVTSPTPGDGKSTTAVNLAISLAQIGKRVLLVDCDMRIPTVAESLRIPATPGLSDFLAGQVKVEHVVYQMDSPKMSVIAAGKIPPDPTRLLEDAQMERLFQAFRSIYDYVIVDMPPIKAVSDGTILARHLDGFLLVVRAHQTRHRYVSESIRQLQPTGAKIIGLAMVGIDAASQKYYKRRS